MTQCEVVEARLFETVPSLHGDVVTIRHKDKRNTVELTGLTPVCGVSLAVRVADNPTTNGSAAPPRRLCEGSEVETAHLAVFDHTGRHTEIALTSAGAFEVSATVLAGGSDV
jgi:hypothetical protein